MNKFIFIFLSFFFSSCMRMMMNDDNHGKNHDPVPTLEKEVVGGQIKAIVIFPQLEINQETTFTVRLIDLSNKQPISNAKIMAHIEYVAFDENMKSDPSHHSEVDSQSSQHWSNELVEGDQAGEYYFKQTFTQAGEYIIHINVLAIKELELEPHIVIDARRNVSQHANTHGGGMFGMGSSTTYIVLGTALMAAVMVGMFFVRGGMF